MRRFSFFFLNINNEKKFPVSYTHLDVYKRQLQHGYELTRNEPIQQKF